ncbi:MAG: TM2 domain-containing protein [Planctomycetes bacterium]|nr:TM2 domain-containing protein [Planctomycetota bacterium]MCB9934209.1 TM2 domain-containing protein [Planctomycetota bacterium]
MAGSPPPGQGYPQQPQGNYPPPGGYQQPGGYAPQGGQPGFNQAGPFGVHPSGLPYSDKQKQTAAILQLIGFVGVGGIGRMYAGQVGLGVAQLLVGWATCGLGLWWSIIDGFMMLSDNNTGTYVDADGRPLRPN